MSPRSEPLAEMIKTSVEKIAEEKRDKDNRIGGSYEKEQLPVNLTDVRSLRSIYEKKEEKVSQHKHSTSAGSSRERRNVEPEEEKIDCSQPAMEDLLQKFRKLELERVKARNTHNGRGLRNVNVDGYSQRCSSLDRKGTITYERNNKFSSGSISSRKTIDDLRQPSKSNTSKHTSTRNTSKIPKDKSVSKLEDTSCISGSNSELSAEYNVSIDEIKKSLGLVPKSQSISMNQPVGWEELPSEGTVQELLNQWKSMENLGSQKKQKKVRFGIDSSWLPESQGVSGKRTAKQFKSCLKSTTVKDKNYNRPKEANVQRERFTRDTIGDENTHCDKERRSDLLNKHNAPPNVACKDITIAGTEEEELPPPSNTKRLLEQFSVLQNQTHR